jgi:hypothetical protein
MLFSQYCRIETLAGGVKCTRLELIRAARTMLSPYGKSRQARDNRREWLFEALEYHANARNFYNLYAK